jgi:excinuclease ABC subunit A
VITTGNWLIDLGPEGEDGVEIVAAGAPEKVVKVGRNYTGRILKPVLGRREVRRKKGAEAAE